MFAAFEQACDSRDCSGTLIIIAFDKTAAIYTAIDTACMYCDLKHTGHVIDSSSAKDNTCSSEISIVLLAKCRQSVIL